MSIYDKRLQVVFPSKDTLDALKDHAMKSGFLSTSDYIRQAIEEKLFRDGNPIDLSPKGGGYGHAQRQAKQKDQQAPGQNGT